MLYIFYKTVNIFNRRLKGVLYMSFKTKRDELIKILENYNQKNLINHLLSLDEKEFELLASQIESIDLEFYFKKIANTSSIAVNPELIKPHKVITRKDLKSNKDEYMKSVNLGEDSLKKGEVAFFIVAGGQGSRLGFEHPKGMFPIGPVSENTLFQIHIEKVIAAGKYYNFKPKLFIMTSTTNNDETKDFLKKNNYFGIKEEDIFIFPQGMLPALDKEKNLILDTKTSLFMAPDGHGGSLSALQKNKMITVMKENGIKYLSYFQIDNSLVNIADPEFIGLHILNKSKVSSKVVKKRDWKEKVGVPAFVDGKPAVVEYSDLPDELAMQTNQSGELLFGFGSIAIHLFDIEFIDSITSKELYLPYHLASKKIPYFNYDSNKVIKPETPNGTKFEQFVFDAIPMADQAIFYETLREEEFAPLKNKEGEDSIDSCKILISNYWKNKLLKNGLNSQNLNDKTIIEISPVSIVDKGLEFIIKTLEKELINGNEKIYIN